MSPNDETGYVLPSTQAEADRLDAQATIYGGADFLDAPLARKPAAVLDVGCGTGFLARHAARALPDSRVVGLDVDPGRLQHAREQGPPPNLEFVQGDLGKLPFDEATFDLVYTRFVLIHLTDPDQALAEMARVLKPGGWLLAYDMVHDGIWFSPPRPALEEVLKITLGVMRERGMEPSQGLHLAPSLIRLGFEDVQAEAITHGGIAGEPVFEAHRENWLQTMDSLGEAIGHQFDPDLIQRAKAELEDDRPDQFLAELTVLASGMKPA